MHLYVLLGGSRVFVNNCVNIIWKKDGKFVSHRKALIA